MFPNLSKFAPVRVVLASAATVALAGLALAGCGGAGSGATPQVSRGIGTPKGTAAAADSSASRAAADSSAKAASSAKAGTGGTSSATSNSLVVPASIPFPVTVGDTWVYQTTTSINGANGTTTNKIVSAVPAAAGYQVTMSETVEAGGSSTTAQPVFIFYPDGTVGYPVNDANGVSVVGDVRWPDAAGIASGRPYHSVLRTQADSSGFANSDVTVRGEGTATVTVPAGTYQATVVDMTIATEVGSFTTTVEVKTWLSAGTGPVKSEVLTHAAGKAGITTTNLLVSFTQGAGRADGS